MVLCPSWTCQATWRRKPHTDTVPIPSNCTGTNVHLLWVISQSQSTLIMIQSVVSLIWVFVFFRLPIPRPGEVLGLVGTNGIGKSTALKILAGKQKPNLGRFDVSFLTQSRSDPSSYVYWYCIWDHVCVFFFKAPPDWQEILAYFRGSELQNYFTKILEDDLKAIVKPQYVDQIPKTVKVSISLILAFILGLLIF